MSDTLNFAVITLRDKPTMIAFQSHAPTFGRGSELRNELQPDLKLTAFLTSAQTLWHSSATVTAATESTSVTVTPAAVLMVTETRKGKAKGDVRYTIYDILSSASSSPFSWIGSAVTIKWCKRCLDCEF